jgi:anti-sigma factor RsiW
MDCLHDAAPSDEQLIGFALDGEALPEDAQEHLAHCTVCQQRIAHYQKSYTSLATHLYRSQCPPGMDLSLYAMDLLSPKERKRIANHVADCPLCSAEIEETYSFMQSWPAAVAVHSPARLPLVRRIFATLVPQPQMQFALRNDAQEQPWPRHYQGEAVGLSLHLSRTSRDELVLLGILTSTDADEDVEELTGVPAELYAAPWPGENFCGQAEYPPLQHSQVDDMGNIVFKSVPIGEYFMVIHLPGREMIVEGLTIENN